MMMAEKSYDESLNRLKANLLVDPKVIDAIENKVRTNQISVTQAISEMKRLEQHISSIPIGLSEQQIESEWSSVGATLTEMEQKISKNASMQYRIGISILPVFIFGVVVSLGFGWQQAPGATAAAGVISACLAAAAAHSFLLLRVYQQASLAAERLTEKRVGVLYLRLAARGLESDAQVKQMESGTAMFLNHQAPSTLPLSSSDMARPTNSSKAGV